MKSRSLCAAVVVWLGCVVTAHADEPNIGNLSCPGVQSGELVQYGRLHQIPTAAAADDPVHRMITPGGMILDQPKMVAATDVLTIASRDQSAMCFGLVTFARDRHRCDVTGLARAESSNTYVFREGDVAVRFTFLSADQVRVEPIGDGYRVGCQSHGRIEPAIYMR
jgi:hypothetical protein